VKGSVVRRLRPIVLGAAAIAAVAAAGCGEKSEPSVHPPTTAAATTTVPSTTPTNTAPGTVTRTERTPTAPVPKTTP
jgi:multidrug efflux pump subunit AcrA (membrane-fusion protein)